MTIGAFLELGGDELCAAARDNVLLEALAEFVEHAAVAEEEALVEDRRADRDVFLRQLYALVDGAEGVTDGSPPEPMAVGAALGTLELPGWRDSLERTGSLERAAASEGTASPLRG